MHQSLRTTILLSVAFLSIIPPTRAGDIPTIYVDANATGPFHDGTTWCTAFTKLSEALPLATYGTTVRVADGIYKPDPTGLKDPRMAHFGLPNGVMLEGGYAGCGAADPDERNIDQLVTTLSGDRASNDGANFTNRDDNFGFITNVLNADKNTVVSGISFRGALWAAMHVASYSSPIVRDCFFTDNGHLTGSSGPAVITRGRSNPVFINCIFRRNYASSIGGAVVVEFSAYTAIDCLFELNRAGMNGGEIFPNLVDGA